MASMTIRNLDEAVLAALEAQAARRGVPVEEEARRVLGAGVAVSATPAAEIIEPAWQILQRIKDEIGGGVELELPDRKAWKMRPVDFGE